MATPHHGLAGDDDDLVYEEENSLRAVLSGGSLTSSGRRIKAATLAKLVDLIAQSQIPPAQPHLEADLVLCYAIYASSQDFVRLIINRYNATDEFDFGPRRKLANLLRMLMHQILADNPHSKAIKMIRHFAEENNDEPFARHFLELVDASQLETASKAPRTSTRWVGPQENSTAPVLLVDPLVPITSLKQVDPQELARQITLIQAQAFQKLSTREYAYWMRARLSMHAVVYHYRLCDPVQQRKMGNLLDIIARFCGTVHWLRLEIRQSAAKDLDATLRYLFAFASELLRVNNLNGLAAVVLVLSDHFAALRALLTPDEVKKLTEIVLLFHSPLGGGGGDHAHHHYSSDTSPPLSPLDEGGGTFHFSHSTRQHRDILFTAQSSVLPFIMPYLDGLQIIMQGSSSFIKESDGHDEDEVARRQHEDDQRRRCGGGSETATAKNNSKLMVSLQKMERASLVLRLVQQYQHRTYAFETVDSIRAFVEQRLQEGVWSMGLRSLRDLCREVVWARNIEYNPRRLPLELVQFLDRSHLPMGDVLYMLVRL